MKKLAIALAFAASATAIAATAQVKPEDQVKQRRSAYAVMGFNFANLAAMAQEKKPYNKEEAGRSADLVAALSDYPRGHFGAGTDKGETKARAEIWQNRADFDAKMDKMITATKALPQAARADLPTLKKAVAEAGGTCKACHDDYRAK
ncbi:MAG TPA: cytochrome c [Usitatibacter sp.]|nr:cytochrome c [Usitatibacter sp.]